MNLSQLQPVTIYNDSGETIPPYACCELKSLSNDDNELVYYVGKPTAAVINRGDSSRYLFNGASFIGSGDGERRGAGYFPGPNVLALVDPTTGVSDTDFENFVGPVNGEWALKSGWMFELLFATMPVAIHDVSPLKTLIVTPRRRQIFTGVASGAITTGGGGTLTMWKYNGSFGFTATTVTKPCVTLVGNVASGRTCIAEVVDNALTVLEVC